jgi:Tol biopolymer transport system component
MKLPACLLSVKSPRPKSRFVAAILALAVLALGAAQGSRAAASPADSLPKPDPKLASAFRDAVFALAADSMEGRGIGSAGIARAAAWIEGRLRAMRLAPAFGDSYRQRFPIKRGVTLVEGNGIDGLKPGDWAPLGFSSSGDFSGELAFVGYGIDAPAIGYNDYGGVDLKGKIALMLRYEPQEKDDASPFDGRRPSRWSALRYKVHQAREHGATAVIFVTGPFQDEGMDRIPAVKNDGPESPAGIPVAQVKASVAARWLAAVGIDLAAFQRSVDRDLTPRSRGATGITLKGRIALQADYADAENVAAMIPGKGSLGREVVVLGAHYDHLGWGGERSMRPNDHAIHSGADDNASGTSAVLLAAQELKRRLRSAPAHRTILFTLFSGEEVGLAGSAHFVAHPPIPIQRIAAMVNLDMVGRLRDNTLVALGLESAPEWRDLLKVAATSTKLDVVARGDGYGPSDQTSFYAKGIPVIHLFTGAHDAYHTPDDKPATVNADGGALVTRFTEVLVSALARRGRAPVYARATSAPAMSGDSRGYGAYLGTVPDFAAIDTTGGGVLLADVRGGSPAERAGIRGGDRVVSIAGTNIENLYDMTYALQDNRPGQTVEVTVVRGGEMITFRATLGDRSQMAQAGAVTAKADAPPAPADAAHRGVPDSTAGSAGAIAGGSAPEPFYEGRPGAEFVVKAGRPFEKAFEGERHFHDIRQLTFGGENAEAYFSPDGRKLIFQATVRDAKCDQQYVLDLESGDVKLVSAGKGRTTCGYFDYPEADRIVYASTRAAADSCPPPPDRSQGYVWAVYDAYEIWEAEPDGTNPQRLTHSGGYDAEATWCHRGGKMVFTSMRDGDLDLYVMNEAGQVRRLTNGVGYDGGAFFSPDCAEIVWRASRPEGAALKDYQRLLARGLIRPGSLEIYVMRADGTGARRLTSNGAANFCPTYLSDGKRVIYSSNAGSAGAREFDLWVLDTRRGEPERVTNAPGFDGFPHFSPDGRFLVWASNRADPGSHETNLFIARWVE